MQSVPQGSSREHVKMAGLGLMAAVHLMAKPSEDHRITEYYELEGTHKDHQVQLLKHIAHMKMDPQP